MACERDFYNLGKTTDSIKSVLDAKLHRITTQLDFVTKFTDALGKSNEWTPLIQKAVATVESGSNDPSKLDAVISEVENILAPIGKVAKEYTIHCVGHAHIDMNWMWSWPDTANCAHDTFYTANKIMEEYPEVKFSQSQVSLYKTMKEYFPELWEDIQKRIKEGKWEVTASTWVEGEKNCASGESLFRHMLYTKKWLAENAGLKPEDVKIDWSPDTFGHCAQIPSIMNKGGVTRYYRMRPHKGPILFKWRAKDGSELLGFRETDPVWGYNGPINEASWNCFCGYVKETKAKDFMYLYGWGDHGGGPTRDQIKQGLTLMTYPIFPKVKFSTTDEFYSAIEAQANTLDIPVVEGDINYIFEGCYTSQANVKFANRVSELELPSAETLAVIGQSVAGMEYPYENLENAWQKTLFNHFHDIFPGSGVRATYNYAQGTFQDILTATSSIKNRALRRITERVNTKAIADQFIAKDNGDGLGGGSGDMGYINSQFKVGGCVTTDTLAYNKFSTTFINVNGEAAEPILVYNPKPWSRSEVVLAKVWNKKLDPAKVCAIDSNGNRIKAQIIDAGNYFGHNYYAVLFEANDIPALGYKVFAIDDCPEPLEVKNPVSIKDDTNRLGNFLEFSTAGEYIIENEFLKLVVDTATGSLTSVVDKESGFEYTQLGAGIGELEYQIEQSNGMSAWSLGNLNFRQVLEQGNFFIVQGGPNKVIVKTDFEYSKSSISLEISLAKNSRQVDFKVRTRWMELGTMEKGVPVLRAYFPANFDDGVATYETPFGCQTKIQDSQEVPALKWFDLTGYSEEGKKHGITLVNKSKYGHSCMDDAIALTLLRSSFNPDPYPELGDHEIEYSVVFHNSDFNVIEAVRAGEDFNNPMNVVSAPIQDGDLPLEKSFAKLLTDNANISAIKKAECGEGIIIRLYELAGKDVTAEVELGDIISNPKEAFIVDALEKVIDGKATLKNGVVSAELKAYSNVSVWVK